MTMYDQVLQGLKRLEMTNTPDRINFEGMCKARIIGSGTDCKLVCDEPGQAFTVPLPGLPEPLKEYDEGQCRSEVAKELASNIAFREFAWYSPLLIGRISTSQEAAPERDVTARLRLIYLLVSVLQDRELYQGVYWLLLRQRFMLLAALALASRAKTDWVERFLNQYFRFLDNEVRRAQRMWGQILIEHADQVVLFLADYYCELDVEEEGKQLILKDEVLWPFLTGNDRDQAFIDYLVSRWFLRRYDLLTATKVVGQAVAKRKQSADAEAPFLFRYGMPYLAVGMSALAVFVAFWTGLSQGWPIISQVLICCSVVIPILLVAMTATTMYRGRMVLYPLALRLPAAAVVGIMAMNGLTDQLSDFLFKAFNHPWAAFVMIMLALAAAYGYILSEVYSRLGNFSQALRRACFLWLYGWACTVLLATVAAWIAIPVGLAECSGLLRRIDVLGGCISVDYTLVSSALALFIGVFIQIFWEDKAITEPL